MKKRRALKPTQQRILESIALGDHGPHNTFELRNLEKGQYVARVGDSHAILSRKGRTLLDQKPLPKRRRVPPLKELKARTRPNKVKCWLWQGRVSNRDGYGIFGAKHTAAHRLAYCATHGYAYEDCPPLRNTCGRRTCINPDHWQPK